MTNIILHIKTVAVFIYFSFLLVSCKPQPTTSEVQPDLPKTDFEIASSQVTSISGGVGRTCPDGSTYAAYSVAIEIKLLLNQCYSCEFDSIWLAMPGENDTVTLSQPNESTIAYNLSRASSSRYKLRIGENNNILLGSYTRKPCETSINSTFVGNKLPSAPNIVASGVISYYKDGGKKFMIIKDMSRRDIMGQ